MSPLWSLGLWPSNVRVTWTQAQWVSSPRWLSEQRVHGTHSVNPLCTGESPSQAGKRVQGLVTLLKTVLSLTWLNTHVLLISGTWHS